MIIMEKKVNMMVSVKKVSRGRRQRLVMETH